MTVLLISLPTLPGIRIGRVLGMVVAAVPYWGSKYAEGIGNLRGRTTDNVSGALERRRHEALARLQAKARDMKANAVLGVTFDCREVTGMWKEVCAYGTAVWLEGMEDADHGSTHVQS